MIRYESVTESRNWYTCLALVATSAVVIWLSALYSVVWAIVFGYPMVRGWWCLITNRKWRTTVGDGKISWDPLFSRRRRSLAISEIARFELYPDNDSEGGMALYFRMAGGKLRPSPARYNDRSQFIAAIVAENPEIEVVHPPNALVEAISGALRTAGGWMGLKE